jgi:hypothetical protein
VCMTLGHRMNRTRGDPRYKDLVEVYYHHRGGALRSLNEEISGRGTQHGDSLLAGIISFLLADVRPPSSRF